MKKLVLLFLVFIIGCASVQIPIYLKDKHPYKQRYYVNFEKSLSVTKQALKELGWEIEETVDPAIYEQEHSRSLDGERSLIITKVRQTALFLGTRYSKMNIFVWSKGDLSEIEIRYLVVTDLPFKNIESYKNESAAQRFFSKVTDLLENK